MRRPYYPKKKKAKHPVWKNTEARTNPLIPCSQVFGQTYVLKINRTPALCGRLPFYPSKHVLSATKLREHFLNKQQTLLFTTKREAVHETRKPFPTAKLNFSFDLQCLVKFKYDTLVRKYTYNEATYHFTYLFGSVSY